MGKNVTERVSMKVYSTDDGLLGHAQLSNIASPYTIKVMLDGEELAPVSFDCYGHPNFTREQCELYRFKNFEYKRENRGNEDIKLEITYRALNFDVSTQSFDTVEGIDRSLCDLRDLNVMLNNRKRYLKVYPERRLNSFVIFGSFWLDEYAQVWSIQKSQKGKVVSKARVEKFEDFRRNNEEGVGFCVGLNQIAIPKANCVCPCCGKILTVYDVQDRYCIDVKGKYYHEDCYKKYIKAKEVLDFTERLMDNVYGKENYQYALLPNGYCSDVCCAHIPWFLFHTVHGDIVMGWRKHVISIEWQSNFAPFNIEEMFKNEDVTKWESQGKRGIHAWGTEKAIEYLEKVRDFVKNSV